MTTLDELVNQANNRDLTWSHGKILPYLGWYWRSIRAGTVISWYDGKYWLNAPKKWGYPSYLLSDEERNELEGRLIEVMEKILNQGGVLEEDAEKFQELFHEYAGDITTTIRVCECGDDYRNGFGFTKHVAEHTGETVAGGESVKKWKKEEYESDPVNDPLEEIDPF